VSARASHDDGEDDARKREREGESGDRRAARGDR
jgi:hypothetical protein